MQPDDELESADSEQAVENEMGEPLLIDPASALSEDRQSVMRREAVLGDLAATHEREPAVLNELEWSKACNQSRVDGGDQDQERVA